MDDVFSQIIFLDVIRTKVPVPTLVDGSTKSSRKMQVKRNSMTPLDDRKTMFLSTESSTSKSENALVNFSQLIKMNMAPIS